MDMWYTHCWFLCRQLQIDIATRTYNYPLTCQGNIEIMWVFLRHAIQGHDLCTLNQCRMFIKTIFLSDICNGTGTHLSKQGWSGFQCSKWINFLWPTGWDLRQRSLMLVLLLDKIKRLAILLGLWHSSNKGKERWFATLDGAEFFSVENHKWLVHTKHHVSIPRPFFGRSNQSPDAKSQPNTTWQWYMKWTIASSSPDMQILQTTRLIRSRGINAQAHRITTGTPTQDLKERSTGDKFFMNQVGAAAWLIKGNSA